MKRRTAEMNGAKPPHATKPMKDKPNNKVAVSPSVPLNCSADADKENAERETDKHEYREGDIDAFFGCDPDFTGNLTTEEHLQKIRSGDG